MAFQKNGSTMFTLPQPIRCTSTAFSTASIVSIEINDIPVAVLKATLHGILEDFEKRRITVSSPMDVVIPLAIATAIAIPGESVG
ncbi:hypothetical protein BGX28_004162 [Mortierella sp. GBA30]|nr:hypothetical protein BGX28_004162 [Mortierella sp. GBA30]